MSAAISTAAGPSLQQECNGHEKIDYGGVAITSSGNITNCHFIYHVAVKDYKKSGSIEVSL